MLPQEIYFMRYATQWYLMVDFWCGVELRVSRGIKGKGPGQTFDPLWLLSDLIRKQGNFRVEQLHNQNIGNPYTVGVNIKFPR